jgi:DNA invertase Pin-like site-specific DNA recombinase
MNIIPTPLIPCAIYRRVSTDHQDGSLEVQEKRVTDYATYKHLSINPGTTFSDPDTSGSVPILERDGGRALLNRLQRGDIKHLVIAKLDRLGRRSLDLMTTIERLEKLGVILHITDFGGDSMSTQGHWGKMILTILAAVAEGELGEIRDHVQKRMDHKFANHELTGNVPFGYEGKYTFASGHVETRCRAIPKHELITLTHTHGAVGSKLLVASG